METLNPNKKNALCVREGKKTRIVSLRDKAKQTGIMLDDGQLWEGIERRASRLLSKTKQDGIGIDEEEKEPSFFFG